MLKQTYLKWLANEVVAVKCALLVALEKKDHLLHIEAPLLKQKYYDKIGFFEEQVLREELEANLMEKKKQMIQICLNRREPIDMEMIDKAIDEERQRMLNKLGQAAEINIQRLRPLEEAEMEELKKLYKDIVNKFHPEVHGNLTENQKILYEKALNAYQRQNLEELRLLHEMLHGEGMGALELELSVIIEEETEHLDPEQIAKKLVADYSLAAELFPCFESLEDDAVLHDAKKRYLEKQNAILSEISMIRGRFPFIAQETLESEEKMEEYMSQLRVRMSQAKERLTSLQSEIENITNVKEG